MICGNHTSLKGNSKILRPEFKLEGTVYLFDKDELGTVTYGFEKSLLTNLTWSGSIYALDVEKNLIDPKFEGVARTNGLMHYIHSLTLGIENSDTPAVKHMINAIGRGDYVALVKSTVGVWEIFGLTKGLRAVESGVGDRYGRAVITLATPQLGNNPALEPTVPPTYDGEITLTNLATPIAAASALAVDTICYENNNLYVTTQLTTGDVAAQPSQYNWIGYYA